MHVVVMTMSSFFTCHSHKIHNPAAGPEVTGQKAALTRSVKGSHLERSDSELKGLYMPRHQAAPWELRMDVSHLPGDLDLQDLLSTAVHLSWQEGWDHAAVQFRNA